jgi:hypothetical protein
MADLKEGEQLNELYRLYGIAAHNCCNIEYRIVYLLLGPKWKQTTGLDPEKVREVYDKLQSLPLGVLVGEYKQHYSFTTENISLMEEVLKKRNYLTHRFFGNYGTQMHDATIQQKMITELKDLIFIFQSVSRSLDPTTWNK